MSLKNSECLEKLRMSNKEKQSLAVVSLTLSDECAMKGAHCHVARVLTDDSSCSLTHSDVQVPSAIQEAFLRFFRRVGPTNFNLVQFLNKEKVSQWLGTQPNQSLCCRHTRQGVPAHEEQHPLGGSRRDQKVAIEVSRLLI